MTEVLHKITSLLNAHDISFELIEHAPEGQTDIASEIRGHALEEAAKAIVMEMRTGKKIKQYALAVVPGHMRVNFEAVAKFFGMKKARMAPIEIAEALTGCIMGAVPPFSFHDGMTVIADSSLKDVGRIFFNAGSLNSSITMSSVDYLAVENPVIACISH